jgi:ABC-type phosphate transport system substrate-binding protein
MTRTHLLGAASAVVLACLTTANSFAAQSTIAGGGSTLAQYDYIFEYVQYNASAGSTGATFGTYYESGSGAGQSAFLNNDLSCDINKVSGANGGNCTGTTAGQPGYVVDYGASDATLSSSQIAGWATSTYGQNVAGNLIQLPSMGVGVSIPVQNSAVTSNGALILSDADLCGVFSGKITDFSQLTVAKPSVTPAAGPITVVVRSDGSGTSFLLTNHLSAVCTTGAGGNSNITFTATTTFASLFPNSQLPSNFSAQKGSSGVAATLEANSSAIGYLSPDFTTIDPNSGANTVNGKPYTLVVASVLNGKTAELPTTALITTGLAHAKLGQTLTPPTTAAAGANPNNYVPLIQTTTAGYPIVGYTTYDFAQCYANPTISAGIIAFLKDHYLNTTYTGDQNNNGFVAMSASGANKFLTVIRQHIIANINSSPAWNVDIEDKTACKGLAGR